MAEARSIVGDSFAPKSWIYWADFLSSLAAGFAGFVFCRRVLSPLEPWYYAVFVIQCLLLYRCSLFIHELVHLREGTFRAFRVVWNLLCGIPFLMPSFIYYTHVGHHRRKLYGTEHDAEYLSLGIEPPYKILVYLSYSFVIPLAALFRFAILTPLSWFSPAVRDFALRRLSSLAMDPSYIRPLPTPRVLRIIRLQELGCCLFIWTMVYRVAAGHTLLGFVPHVYATAVFIVMLNAIRTLGSHRWTNAGGEMTFLEQLHDSVNYPHRPWVTALWGPLGLRYHALHHLFPSMPYHAMGMAHRRLMAKLPAESPYRQLNRLTLTETLVDLWRQAQDSQRSAAPTLAAR